MLYAVLKALHILGVVLLVGNAIVTLVWKMAADRTGSASVIAFAQQLVTLTDWRFTVGGVVVIMLTGFGAAGIAGIDLLGPRWLVWGEGLLLLSGALWAFILVPAQIRQAHQARIFAKTGEIPSSYWRDVRRWNRWGLLATTLLIGAIWVMVAKPA
ncbi:DUF2269 domain-containing protein [Thiorhodococcus minor]|uniref:DUF2269 domain-containing protein n=2 Tax=Thiorhodococcus minor TaxID=57489 RepID=A0A6M0K8U3_9GAMM|nr:DUF2269 domain-containing protein [Thiorhodococcus minor]